MRNYGHLYLLTAFTLLSTLVVAGHTAEARSRIKAGDEIACRAWGVDRSGVSVEIPQLAKTCLVLDETCPLANAPYGQWGTCLTCDAPFISLEWPVDYRLNFEGTIYRTPSGNFVDEDLSIPYDVRKGVRSGSAFIEIIREGQVIAQRTRLLSGQEFGSEFGHNVVVNPWSNESLVLRCRVR